jgi:hypothetical protein
MTGKDAGRVIKRIGSSHVIWFPESNRWVEFKEPAWLVYKMHHQGAGSQATISRLTGRYDLPEREAVRFYGEILEGMNILARKDFNPLSPVSAMDENRDGRSGPVKTRHYLIGEKHITIAYGSAELEHYIHRPLAWLEAAKTGRGSLHMEVLTRHSGAKIYGLLLEGKRGFEFSDPGRLKHKMYVAITSHIFGIPEEGWMAFIHASAVTDGREAILLSSASGSGKSTMAALLQLHDGAFGSPGRKRIFFMSDDFVPVEAGSLKAFPFPAALTIKKGSFPAINDHYDPADDADAGYSGARSTGVRYLRPRLPGNGMAGPGEVKKIIFIKYNAQVNFEMARLPVIDALSAFHEEAWVSHSRDHAKRFIDWFVTLDCYRLEYSDNRSARDAIIDLFPPA